MRCRHKYLYSKQVINIYFIYDAFLTTIVLKQTKTEINDKGKIFEARLMNKK